MAPSRGPMIRPVNRPDLPVVIMSGDHGQFPEIRSVSPHLLRRLSKPFSFRELSATVSAVLGP